MFKLMLLKCYIGRVADFGSYRAGSFPGLWIGRRELFDWPARLPDLTPCDFFLWKYLKDIVFKKPCISIMQLQNRIREACAGITKAICRKICHSVTQRLRHCFEKDGQFLSS